MVKKIINRYKSTPLAAKAAGWFVVCSAVQNGASFLSMPLLVRMFTTEEYGIYSIFRSWVNIISVFATLKMSTNVFNNAMFKYPERRSEYMSSVQSISVAGTIVCFLVYLCFNVFWDRVFGLPAEFSMMIFVQILFTEGFLIWMARQRYEYKYKGLVVATVAFSLSYLVVPILVGYFSARETRLAAVIYSGVMVQAAFGLGFMLYNYIKGRCFFNPKFWRFALRFNLPLIPHFLSGIVLGEADRIMIRNIVGSAQAGIYSFVYTISIVINIVTSAISNALIPQIYEALKSRDLKFLKAMVNVILLAVGGMILLFSAVAPEVIKIFATEEYYGAIRLVPIISLSSFFGFLYVLFANVEFFFEESGLVAAASMTGAIANVALNALLIPFFGYYAAGYTTFICYILYSIVHFIFMKAVCRKKMDSIAPYDYRSIGAISSGMVVAAFAMLLIYDYWYIRYAILTMIIVAAFMKRGVIIEKFRIFIGSKL